MRTRYTEDIPSGIQPVVTEHTIHRDWCPKCKKQVEPRVPDALPGGQIGNRTLAMSAWLHYGLGNTLSQIIEVFNHHLHFKLTPGGLVQQWYRLQEILFSGTSRFKTRRLKRACVPAQNGRVPTAAEKFPSRRERITARLDELIVRPWKDKQVRRLIKRFKRHREHSFMFSGLHHNLWVDLSSGGRWRHGRSDSLGPPASLRPARTTAARRCPPLRPLVAGGRVFTSRLNLPRSFRLATSDLRGLRSAPQRLGPSMPRVLRPTDGAIEFQKRPRSGSILYRRFRLESLDLSAILPIDFGEEA